MSDVKKLNPELQDKDPQLTKEELASRREEITAFYKDNIPHLTVQAEYEELLATIDKARAERLQAQIFMAQAAAQQQGAEGPSEDEKEFKAAMEKAATNVE
jgi:E3 ubiquitin-protein ligase DOA10|tara:strand:- start:385 stop:687 length:303 start_codon:yes stop_codon:yes gene_type:complete